MANVEIINRKLVTEMALDGKPLLDLLGAVLVEALVDGRRARTIVRISPAIVDPIAHSAFDELATD